MDDFNKLVEHKNIYDKETDNEKKKKLNNMYSKNYDSD